MKRWMLLISSMLIAAIVLFYVGKELSASMKKRNEVEWWEKNSIEIRSLNSDDYKDLQFLKPLLENKNYVFLGESSHGVAEFNLAKVRIAKYLHKELGFDVIAFESPMAEASIAYAQKEAQHFTGKDLLGKSVFNTWNTREVSPLFSDIIENQRSNQLILTGFDVQAVFDTFGEFVSETILQSQPDYADEFKQLEIEYKVKLTGHVNGTPLTEEDVLYFKNGYAKAIQYVQDHSKSLKDKYKERPELLEILNKGLQDRAAFPERLYKNSSSNVDGYFQVRDEMMAENLVWLAKEVYPDKKMIIWGHNTHIRDNNTQISIRNFGESSYSQLKAESMFGNLPREMKEESYNIGFYLHEGRIANNFRQSYKVNAGEKHGKDTLEYTLNKAGHEYSFIDISKQKKNQHNAWMFTPIQALSAGIDTEKLIIQKSYDALFFIKKGTPPMYYEN